MQKLKKWWEEPFRIFDHGYIEEIRRDFDRDQDLDWIKSHGWNAIHLTCLPGHKFAYPQMFDLLHPEKKSVNEENLRLYAEGARERGLHLIVYMHAFVLHHKYMDAHPEWMQRTAEGKTTEDMMGSGKDVAPCPNTDWKYQMRDVALKAAELGVDGIFFDGPVFFKNTCYCEACRNGFLKKYGREMPPKSDRSHQDYKLLVEFQSQIIADFLRITYEALAKVDRDVLVYMNGNGWSSVLPSGRDNRKGEPYQDIIATEGGFIFHGRPIDLPLWKPGINAKIVEMQARGKSTVIFLDGRNKPFDYHMLPPAEVTLLHAETVANGANPWFALTDNHIHKNSPELEAVTEINAFLEKNVEFFTSTSSAAKVALMFPANTAEFYEGSQMQESDFTDETKDISSLFNFTESLYGIYESIFRSHIPFDMIDEVALGEEKIKEYDLIILPNCACLSKKDADNIREFVRAGGNLISTSVTSLNDRLGKRLDDFQLADVFGVRCENKVIAPAYKRGNNPVNLDYIIKTGESALFDNLCWEVVPSSKYAMQVSATTGKVVSEFCEKRMMRYDYFNQPESVKQPAIVINEYGKGKSIYFAGAFWQDYWYLKYPEHRVLMENAVKMLSTPQIRLENAPVSVEVILRRQKQKNRLLIHLINFTGGMSRPIEEIIPIHDIKINIDLPQEITSARALWLDQELPFTKSGTTLELTLPKLNEYEVIALQ